MQTSDMTTHVTVILDRTGSMQSIRDDTIGGFNTFLSQQKETAGRATMTLVQFDSQEPYEVIHDFVPLAEVPELTRESFVPRASTPLLDAIGRGINDLEARLAGMDEMARPQQVVLVIITDGQENASREFSKGDIEKMIGEKQAANWQFVFLSADLAAIGEALAAGFRPASAMMFDKTSGGTRAAFHSVSQRLSEYRAGGKASIDFTDEDRDQQESEKKRR